MAKKKTLTICPYSLVVVKNQNYLFPEKAEDLMVCHIKRLQKKTPKERCWEYRSKTTGEYLQILEIKQQNGYYLFGFSRLCTDEGPARGNMHGGIEPFDLGPDEGFSNLSVALYDPKTNFFIAEQSKASFTAETMLDYIQKCESELHAYLRLNPILKKDILNKLRDGSIVSRLNFKFEPAGLSQEDYDNNESLRTAALFASQNQRTGTIQIILGSRGKDINLGISGIGMKLLEAAVYLMTKYVANNPVKKLEVRVKQREDMSLETLDLLNAREILNEDVAISVKKLISLPARYSAIIKAYNNWKNQHFSTVSQ